MLVKKSIHKVKNVIHKRLKNLRSFVSKGYNQNQMSRVPSFSTIPSNNTTNMQQVDNFNRDMSEESCIRRNEVVKAKKSNSVTRSTAKDLNGMSNSRKDERTRDVYNKDHVMDIEEALHYYSLITCPVYQDIVDRFFMDIYSEFLLPHPSASIHNSTRRLHSTML
ncbi:hypothetical protein POM88_032208 [Heracleum sosnowskyi]|uniref:Uncharacterized protein n=1 Tax=Heracleum sosnowskyi TaxID=360622 RepID=A0AAD8I1S7_9APIA|nr:hypothetical protein POM88_032208 [Heracleum sosnowskyi]